MDSYATGTAPMGRARYAIPEIACPQRLKDSASLYQRSFMSFTRYRNAFEDVLFLNGNDLHFMLAETFMKQSEEERIPVKSLVEKSGITDETKREVIELLEK